MRRLTACGALTLALALALALPCRPAAAKDELAPHEKAARDERLQKAISRISHEPTVQEVAEQAVKYYQVEPETLAALSRSANLRGLMPILSGRFGYGRDQRVRSLDDPLVPLDTTEDYRTGAYGLSATITWDLPTLVFNAAELQTYALTGIRINVLKEVSRIYFIRRQVLLQLLVNPPEDPLGKLALEQRVLEFTALIDSFTGGYFSRELEQRGLNVIK